jgi:hypothetical protein
LRSSWPIPFEVSKSFTYQPLRVFLYTPVTNRIVKLSLLLNLGLFIQIRIILPNPLRTSRLKKGNVTILSFLLSHVLSGPESPFRDKEDCQDETNQVEAFPGSHQHSCVAL